MRRYTALIAALILALCACGTCVAEDAGGLQVISCPEQGFSTLTAPSCNWSYEELGVYIDVGEGDDAPWVMIARADAPGSAFDHDNYFNNVFTPQMRDNLGDSLTSVGSVQTYSVAGVEMKGVLYTYTIEGVNRVCFCAVDLREDGFVRYETRYNEADRDDAETVLAAAVYYFQPDPDYYAADGASGQTEPEPEPEDKIDTAGLRILSCPDLGFATCCDPAYDCVFDAHDGVYIYTGDGEGIPYVLLYRTGDIIAEPAEYITEQWTPHMQEQYGSDLLSYSEYTCSTGGKDLPAGMYAYRLQGYTINMLRAYEVTPEGTVVYTAKYIEGKGDATLAALDMAARYMAQDANAYAE